MTGNALLTSFDTSIEGIKSAWGPLSTEVVAACRKHLEDLLRASPAEEWLAGLHREAPANKELYRDPTHGFVLLAHTEPEGLYRPPHDHGRAWVVYALQQGEIEMGTYARLEDPDGSVLDETFLTKLEYIYWEQLAVKDAHKNSLLTKVVESLREKINLIRFMTEEQIKKVRKGDELPPGVIKMVKVYVAIKRKLQVGDKMAGRHGNKGVVSRILPEEDMPFLADGRPVDIVLNPLGVPSRMNVGQILETHLGWAAKGLGEKLQTYIDQIDQSEVRKNLEKILYEIWDAKELTEFVSTCSNEDLVSFVRKYREGVHLANPVFDGATENEIKKYLKLADLDDDGQVNLFDGRTGNKFDNRVTVGVMYVLKLHHLVDEKIHARSIGPYSLVTQQPLGGKAQFGGQRLGEMEVWAMEAYGAANTLQEFLTVKSDDVLGRTRMYESIVKGQNQMTPGLPESFNVLVKELQALALDVNLIRDDEELGLDSFTQ